MTKPQSIVCGLCWQACRLLAGQKGFCGVRQALAGPHGLETVSLVKTGIASCNIDPVEKKPLYHYLPGSLTFSFGSMGCNLDCAWCQNDSISRFPAENGRIVQKTASPEFLISQALAGNCQSVAFTYTEPTVFFELMREAAKLALAQGLGTIMVSNGFQSPKTLAETIPLIQAANIDLKSFSDETYKKYCHGRLQPVLDNLKSLAAAGVWLEVTTLVIPGVNDTPHELAEIASFIKNELGADVPWHISAFHPARKMRLVQPTPLSTLQMAHDLGLDAGLRHVYLGNIGARNATRCPACACSLIERQTYKIKINKEFAGVCPECGTTIAGFWSKA